MRHLPARVAVLIILGLQAGCTVGDGTGSAAGNLYVKGCKQNNVDYGKLEAPAVYNLKPDFFAGEPIEDIKKNGSINRIVIRLQDSGKSIENDDLLQFDVVNSYLVATCLAGKALPGELFQAFCQKPAGQTRPRMRIGPNMPIRVSLAVRDTCPFATRVGTARDADASRVDEIVQVPVAEWRSWIDFREFGSATSGNVPPTFRVEFNERITADRFHVELIDDRVIDAQRRQEPPPEPPDLTGMLDGNFDFELERGQGAQTFP